MDYRPLLLVRSSLIDTKELHDSVDLRSSAAYATSSDIADVTYSNSAVDGNVQPLSFFSNTYSHANKVTWFCCIYH